MLTICLENLEMSENLISVRECPIGVNASSKLGWTKQQMEWGMERGCTHPHPTEGGYFLFCDLEMAYFCEL